MGEFKQIQRLSQKQVQKQVQRMSQKQIQAVTMLGMSSKDLREQIYKAVDDNPALEIVSDPLNSSADEFDAYQRRNSESYSTKSYNSGKADSNQSFLDSREDRGETLQQHLMSQLNLQRISQDEYDLSKRLIYNLDKNGCYGSSQAPETLIDKTRPLQTKEMLVRCMEMIQEMDPVGTCCKTPEESLYVQAKVKGDASELTMFILDGRLELINPPQPERVLKNLKEYRQKWHSKTFAPFILLDKLTPTKEMVEESINYILSLNPRPAGNYYSDTVQIDFEKPDVILVVTKEDGILSEDNLSEGKICGGKNYYYQVKYASGELPVIKLAPNYKFDKENIDKAKSFLDLLEYRENSIVQQGSAIVRAQKEFFEKGPGHLVPLTRRTIAAQIGVHESTVSRMSSKNNSRYIQTDWGAFPASYFFCSGVEEISSDEIKSRMQQIISEHGDKNLSDSKLTQLLNDSGIKIARRTVAKYRSQLGIKNSYLR